MPIHKMTPRQWLGWLLAWAGHVGLWILFTAPFNWQDFFAGLIASTVAMAGVGAFAILRLVTFLPRWRDLAQGWRIPGYLITGTAAIFRALIRLRFGRDGLRRLMYAAPFDDVSDAPASRARRALAITWTTVTPDVVVLGIIPKQRLMLYHPIVPGPMSRMTRNLGAGA